MKSPGIGDALKRLPSKEEGHQQLLVLAPSVWEPLLDDFSFGPSLCLE